MKKFICLISFSLLMVSGMQAVSFDETKAKPEYGIEKVSLDVCKVAPEVIALESVEMFCPEGAYTSNVISIVFADTKRKSADPLTLFEAGPPLRSKRAIFSLRHKGYYAKSYFGVSYKDVSYLVRKDPGNTSRVIHYRHS